MTVAVVDLSRLASPLAAAFRDIPAEERLEALVAAGPGRIVFTTSFGLEDQALTAMIAAAELPIDVVTLDTGRLFPETYDVWRETERFLGRRIASFHPDAGEIEALLARQGVDGFRDSVANRHACCGVRKVAPLGRALRGAGAWVTGLRGGQSAHRTGMDFVSFDAARGLIKANPIFDWSREEAEDYARRAAVPVNALHARGFPSIGCAPCTRAVAPGEDERAGRWWWETSDKECGLHVDADGRLVRAAAGQGSGLGLVDR